MKKIVCMVLIAVTLCVPLAFGMTSTPQTSQPNTAPLSSQEMQSLVGGFCICFNLWIFQICFGSSGGCE
jgi:hypothetical protein